MRKVQACNKCGKVFAVKETTGPGLGMPNISEMGSKVCPSCGADAVVWKEEGQSAGPGCTGMVLILVCIGCVGGYIIW